MKLPIKLSKPTTLILGTARSGTTWLAQILSSPNRYRFLFEPFHTEYFELANLVADKYFKTLPDQKIQKYIYSCLSDKINSDWIRQNVSKNILIRKNPFWAKKIICKDIRTILMIPIYRKLFGQNLKIVGIIRDPYYVINSMLRTNFPWTFDVRTLLSNKILEDEYQIYISKLSKYSDTKVGQLTIRWTVENLFFHKIHEESNVLLIQYEKLKKEPNEEISRICRYANLEMPKNLEAISTAPSYTTHKRSHLFSDKAQSQDSETNKLITEILNISGYPL